MAKSQETEEICSALRHETRREILRTMDRRDEPLGPKDLADEYGLPLSQVAYHVNVLADCELVTLVGTSPAPGTMKLSYGLDQKVKKDVLIRKLLGLDPRR
jgi:DNA-binding transcriptional ArsR family regulator